MTTLAEIRAQQAALELSNSLPPVVSSLAALKNALDRATGFKTLFLENATAQQQADLLPGVMAEAKAHWDGAGGRVVLEAILDKVAGMMINPATSQVYTRNELIDDMRTV